MSRAGRAAPGAGAVRPAEHRRQSAQVATAQHGMVVSQERQATRIGVDILQQGGNAVDAAVAVGFALAVTLPKAGNIGGGGFMLVHLAGRNGRSRSTTARPRRRRRGPTYSSTPTARRTPASPATPASASACPARWPGCALAHARYGSGKFTLAELIAPAIRLAREGFRSRTTWSIRCCWRSRGWRDGPRRLAYSSSRTARPPRRATSWSSPTSPTPWRRSHATGRALSMTARSPTRSSPRCAPPAA